MFLDCKAVRAHGFSGSIGSWASGELFDNVDIDGGNLDLTNLEMWNQGVGWAAANSVLWNCSASEIQTVFRHFYGLWYDRRRASHVRVRRADGDVWPPFFEQPFVRSGQGQAWDGLSRYDLSRYNPWYFGRLREFAGLATQKGLVLLNEMFFQHNILEAGAHWVDCPWRPANCIQETGFPEPPVFRRNDGSHMDPPELGWRVFMAEYFYVQDAILADPKRVALIDVIDLSYWWRLDDGREFAPRGGTQLAMRQHEDQWEGGKPSPAAVAGMVREYREKFPNKVTVQFGRGDGRG